MDQRQSLDDALDATADACCSGQGGCCRAREGGAEYGSAGHLRMVLRL
ncbi:hypothetical protein OG873_39590 [Streptomyces violaceus]|nr:hypothetical protein [Streptomyces violaceus]